MTWPAPGPAVTRDEHADPMTDARVDRPAPPATTSPGVPAASPGPEQGGKLSDSRRRTRRRGTLLLLGDYSFTGLAGGDYTVVEVQQTGWNQSHPAS